MSNLAPIHTAASASTPRPAISAWPDVDSLYRRFDGDRWAVTGAVRA